MFGKKQHKPKTEQVKWILNFLPGVLALVEGELEGIEINVVHVSKLMCIIKEPKFCHKFRGGSSTVHYMTKAAISKGIFLIQVMKKY